MSFDMTTEPVAIKMVERERGDLFAVITPERSLIVQLDSALLDADSAVQAYAPGILGVDKSDAGKLYLRLKSHGSFTPCRYLQCAVACPQCAATMRIAGEAFVCTECGNAV